jgi:type II secretory pathway component GspD/PulD (secretin)
MRRLAALALFCGILVLNPGTAQDRKSAPPAPEPVKPQRALYTVRHADPLLLAEVAGAHFKGEATVIAAPAGSGHAVLVSGSTTAVPEVVKLLEQLDKKPRTVEVEITIAELPAKDGKEPTPADLAAAALKDGKGQRIKLTAVEGQQVTTQTGGNKPYVSGAMVAGPGGGFGKGGAAQRSISYQPVGTTVKMTPRIGADNAVALELNVSDNKLRQPDAGDEVGAPSMENHTLTTKLNIPAGRSVVAQSVRTETKAGIVISLVVATARVVDEKPGTGVP